MVYLLGIFMAIVPFLLGRGALCLLYRKQPVQGPALADSVLTGYMLMLGLAEAAYLAAIVLGQSFLYCVKLFVLFLGICLAAMAAVAVWNVRRQKTELFHVEGGFGQRKKREWVIWFLFALLVLGQAGLLVWKEPVYLGGDMTVETVNSFLTDNGIYQVDPMTGEPYQMGIPMRLKILCLPAFYGILCSLFGLQARQVVWVAIPVITLFCSYLAYHILARIFFPDSGEKRGCFMILVGILYWAGDYMYGMDGFGVMHSGFRGVTIRAAVLLPYVLGSVCRKRWKSVVLCILAEACMVWTLYGMGACLLTAAALAAVRLLIKSGRIIGR